MELFLEFLHQVIKFPDKPTLHYMKKISMVIQVLQMTQIKMIENLRMNVVGMLLYKRSSSKITLRSSRKKVTEKGNVIS